MGVLRRRVEAVPVGIGGQCDNGTTEQMRRLGNRKIAWRFGADFVERVAHPVVLCGAEVNEHHLRSQPTGGDSDRSRFHLAEFVAESERQTAHSLLRAVEEDILPVMARVELRGAVGDFYVETARIPCEQGQGGMCCVQVSEQTARNKRISVSSTVSPNGVPHST